MPKLMHTVNAGRPAFPGPGRSRGRPAGSPPAIEAANPPATTIYAPPPQSALTTRVPPRGLAQITAKGQDMTPDGSQSNAAADEDKKVASHLKRITEFLSSDTASKSLTSLVDTWTAKSRSKADVRKLLGDLDSADKERKHKIDKIRKKIRADRRQIKQNDDLVRASKETEARLAEQIAHVDVRLAERSRARAELNKQGRQRRQRLDELLKELELD